MKTKLIYVFISLFVIVCVLLFVAAKNSYLDIPFLTNSNDRAWHLFQKYLDYNQNNDLEGVKSVVYRVSPVCEDEKTKLDCEARMQAAYSYGAGLKKSDFKNVWEDSKQLILSTDFWTEESEDAIARFRSTIFFIKNEDRSMKLLSFNPKVGALVNAKAAPLEELRLRVERYTEDNDFDGKNDYDEECLSDTDKSGCIKTDTKLRDTDQNGWWDGVEMYFR